MEKTCVTCGQALHRDAVGACLKFLGRDTPAYYCLSCLARELGTTEEKLKERIDYYRQMGCSYFD